jgi:hypothetical protein
MTTYFRERDIQRWPWPKWVGPVTRPEDIPARKDRAIFHREKTSYRGLATKTNLKRLLAHKVDQDFFEEVCQLKGLEYLELHLVTADDFSSISKLENLQTIKLHDVRRPAGFECLLTQTGLRKLFIENARHLSSLDFLSDAHHLESIGIEGNMWTKQKVDSLEPLSGLTGLEALFMTTVQLRDKDLSGLAACPKLRLFECARFAPKVQFDNLRALMPDLQCIWCDHYEIDS